MSPAELNQVAIVNLIETYVALGTATSRASLLDEDGLVGCLGDFPHPICNFAICQPGPAIASDKLKRFATEHSGFHVYVSVARGSRSAGPSLLRAGFKQVHELVQMVSAPGLQAAPMAVQATELPDERRKIARFMMTQFFSRHPDWVRDRVCEATAMARGLDLYALHAGREMLGAVMLRPSAGSVGLYNLCVAAMQRGKGHGSEIVRMVQQYANSKEQPVILQCNEELEPWYRKLGFSAVGSVEVYAAAPSTR
jgi:ribosomal protein S18 acetylase RimI-like enzyme